MKWCFEYFTNYNRQIRWNDVMNILPMGTQSKCMFSLLLRSNYRKTCVTQLLLISILHPLGWMDMADYPSLSCSLIPKIKDSVAIPSERLLNFPMLVESQLATVTVTVVELFPSPLLPPPFELSQFCLHSLWVN